MSGLFRRTTISCAGQQPGGGFQLFYRYGTGGFGLLIGTISSWVPQGTFMVSLAIVCILQIALNTKTGNLPNKQRVQRIITLVHFWVLQWSIQRMSPVSVSKQNSSPGCIWFPSSPHPSACCKKYFPSVRPVSKRPACTAKRTSPSPISVRSVESDISMCMRGTSIASLVVRMPRK